MTTEQREAIEYLKEMKNNQKDLNKSGYVYANEKIDTALSLMKEQQEEIEKLKVNLAKSCADRTLDRETLKNQENENLEALHRAYNEELDKKNKQIDLMAEYISKRDVEEDICMKNKTNPDWCNEDYTNCKDCIKQYFKELAERKNE